MERIVLIALLGIPILVIGHVALFNRSPGPVPTMSMTTYPNTLEWTAAGNRMTVSFPPLSAMKSKPEQGS